MSDDHNRFAPKGPKHLTPLAGSGGPPPRRSDPFAGTPTVDATAATHELARREREQRAEEFDDRSGVNDSPAVREVRTYERVRSATLSVDDMRERMRTAESSLNNLKGEVSQVALSVADLKGSVLTLVSEFKETRLERVERERRAETRAEEADKREADRELRELEARRARTRQILGIWVPTITALLAGIAAVIAATRDPAVKYMPQVPNTPTIESPSHGG